MSLPQHLHLPKPPPKALPGARAPLSPASAPPGAKAAANPAPGGRTGGSFGAGIVPATPTPASQGTGAGTQGRPPVPGRVMPSIDVRILSPSLGPMVEAIRLYDDLLCEENVALKAGDSKKVEALLDRKMAATRLYQERLRTLLADPQSTRGLAPDQRSAVVAMVRCLEDRAKENTILLKANMGAIEQLFEVINTAARKMRRQEVAYSKAGMMCDTYMRNGVSLAYNHTI